MIPTREYTGAGRYPGYKVCGRFEGVAYGPEDDKYGSPEIFTANYAWTLEEAFALLQKHYPNSHQEVVEHDSKKAHRGPDGCITHHAMYSSPSFWLPHAEKRILSLKLRKLWRMGWE